MTKQALDTAARWFAGLLLREPSAAEIESWHSGDVAPALTALGIEPPPPTDADQLAATYFELFLHPQGASPPIQSLWSDGEYEGEATRAIRQLAEAAGLEFDQTVARGAAPDHLGCILLLWSETVHHAPELAARIEQHHLAWAVPALRHATQDEGFYGQVARALVELVEQLRA